MSSIEATDLVRHPVVRDLVTVLFRPRETMRRVLARRDSMVIPILLLVMTAGFIRDLDINAFSQAVAATPTYQVVLIVCGVFLAVALLFIGLLWLFGWVVAAVGRLFEGNATARQVRSALAWGLVPLVWSLLYRAPLMFVPSLRGPGSTFVRISEESLVFRPGRFSGCGMGLLYELVELGMIVWVMVLTSHTVAEAHGYSAWRGFGTLLVAMISPAIVLLAAFLASR